MKSINIADNSADMFCLAETFLKGNDKPRDLHSDFNWIGKCRTQSKGKGGIGICVNSDIKILDDNLINSQCNTFERLWILCRINGIKTAVGVVYFPNDGVDKNKTDLLFYELLKNCSMFQSHGYETCLTGDVNGKSLRQCEITGKSLLCKDNHITVLYFYSSVKLLNWILLIHLTVATASILEYSMIKDQI
jgi:hypothetical protein